MSEKWGICSFSSDKLFWWKIAQNTVQILHKNVNSQFNVDFKKNFVLKLLSELQNKGQEYEQGSFSIDVRSRYIFLYNMSGPTCSFIQQQRGFWHTKAHYRDLYQL